MFVLHIINSLHALQNCFIKQDQDCLGAGQHLSPQPSETLHWGSSDRDDPALFFCCIEMGSELPGTVTMPGAVGAGQVRMGGTVPGRGGKRRSGGWVSCNSRVLNTLLQFLKERQKHDFLSAMKWIAVAVVTFKDLVVILWS